MKPIGKFADYNKDNILGNLIQAETHLKNLTDTVDPNYSACINKHLLEAEMELSELIAHEPDEAGEYRRLMAETRSLRKDNISGSLSVEDAISRLRAIRGDFERRVPGHNVEKCRACNGELVASLKEQNREEKSLNMESAHGLNMDKKLLTQSLVGTALGKGVSYGTGTFIPGATVGIANKTLVNLAIGIGIDAYVLLSKKDKFGKYAVPAVSAANYLIVEEIGNMLLGMIPKAPASMVSYAPAAANGKVAVSISPAVGVASYSNGQHVFVD